MPLKTAAHGTAGAPSRDSATACMHAPGSGDDEIDRVVGREAAAADATLMVKLHRAYCAARCCGFYVPCVHVASSELAVPFLLEKVRTFFF